MPGPAAPWDMLVPLAIAAIAGYLLGALPFGYLVARARGVDIFTVGSRSSGSTNVRRVLGSGAGNTVLALDVLKGCVAAGWPLLVVWSAVQTITTSRTLGYAGLAFALLGHSFSCFTGFKGGKGVATAAGGLLVLMPWVAFSSAGIWVIIFSASRFVSLASILAALSLPGLAILYKQGTIALWVCVAVALFVVIRHRANVVRLVNGTEKRFERKKAKR
jgi:acyl phosphate:glycerol-3-phosphate acyltransferase